MVDALGNSTMESLLTPLNKLSFVRTDFGGLTSLRATITSGTIPSPLSSRIAFWAGLVLNSPLAPK